MKSTYTSTQIIQMLIAVCKASYPSFEEWVEYKEAMKFLESQKEN